MRASVIVAAALTLIACASPQVPVPLGGAASGGSTIIVGTLSTNPCEERTAPVYTAAIVAAERAAAYVRSGQLDARSAQRVLDLGRGARADLDAACPNKVLDAGRLASAEVAVINMQTILGGVR